MTMAELSTALFPIGVVFVALGFAAHVGHAVMLANGRRAALPVLSATRQPAFAGVVTGSFVTESTRAATGGPTLAASPSPLSRAATVLSVLAVAFLGRLAAPARHRRGPRAVGQHVRVHGRVLDSMVAGYLVLSRRYAIRSIGFIPLGVALMLLLYASSLPSEISRLVPALQNPPLLTIHVGMAVLSYGIFATAFAAGVAYLIQGQDDRFAWLPSHKVLDEVAYRAVIIGFPIFATMIILGSWWASIAWSRYWGWDPKETAALVTWLTYAVYLHARNRRSWAGRPAALLLVVGFGMVLVTYSGSLWFSGLHSYSGL